MHCVTLYSNHALIEMIGVVHLCNEVASVLMEKVPWVMVIRTSNFVC
jgi:hypothetical protein